MRAPAAVLLLAAAACAAAGTPSADGLADARATAGALSARLQGELQQALGAGGPLAAITACNEKAPQLAAEVGTARGWRVGRTALRVRNAANAPDAWEKAVLERFAARLAAGEPAATVEEAVVETAADGSRRLRYMKAIPVGEPCTLCHGDAVAPALLERIRALYPADEATGFRTGELRGAFTLEQALTP